MSSTLPTLLTYIHTSYSIVECPRKSSSQIQWESLKVRAFGHGFWKFCPRNIRMYGTSALCYVMVCYGTVICMLYIELPWVLGWLLMSMSTWYAHAVLLMCHASWPHVLWPHVKSEMGMLISHHKAKKNQLSSKQILKQHEPILWSSKTSQQSQRYTYEHTIVLPMSSHWCGSIYPLQQ